MSNTSYPDGRGTKSSSCTGFQIDKKSWMATPVQLPKKTSMHSIATEHILSGRSEDCIVLIDDKKYPVHFFILQSYTTFFEGFRNLQVICLPVDKVTHKSFEFIYKWMLDNKTKLPLKHILDIFRAATFLEIKDLLTFVWSLFDEERIYNESSAALLQVNAKKRGINNLTPVLFNRISKFFLSYVATKAFCELCIEEICLLLSLSTVGVNTEIEILMAIAVWLNHDFKTRNVYVNRLLKCVRFYLLPICYLHELCFGKHTTLIPRLLCTPEVKKFALDCFKRLTNPFANYYKHMSSKQRKWIYDKNCPYHHNEVCTHAVQLEYNDFIDYLNLLKQNNKDQDYWKSIVYKKEMPCQHQMYVSPENKNINDGLRRKAPYVHVDKAKSAINMICSESLMELTDSSTTTTTTTVTATATVPMK